MLKFDFFLSKLAIYLKTLYVCIVFDRYLAFNACFDDTKVGV